MVLAQKMVREDGVLLCQKGAELTEGLLRIFKRLNFETVPIEEENTESPDERSARVTREEALLEARFSRVTEDPVLMALKQALLKRMREEG
ncbi:MAG: hypothetical protein V1816_18475 [Pseudomonadota bacterium]